MYLAGGAPHLLYISQVEHRISFVLADYTQIAHRLKADVVRLAPPWIGLGPV